jgi:hypothetical protein
MGDRYITLTGASLIVFLIGICLLVLVATGLSVYALTTHKVNLVNYVVRSDIENDVDVEENLVVNKTFAVDQNMVVQNDVFVHDTLVAKNIVSRKGLILADQIISSETAEAMLSTREWASVEGKNIRFPVTSEGAVDMTLFPSESSYTVQHSLQGGDLYSFLSNPKEGTVSYFTLDPGLYGISFSGEGFVSKTRPVTDVTITASIVAYGPELIRYQSNVTANSTLLDKTTWNLRSVTSGGGNSVYTSGVFPVAVKPFQLNQLVVSNVGLQLQLGCAVSNCGSPGSWVFSRFKLSVFRFT